jgi:hypothetical protein
MSRLDRWPFPISNLEQELSARVGVVMCLNVKAGGSR